MTNVEKDQHVVGLRDHSEHPVYQTKWLKFGLSKLEVNDPYEIPEVFDDYSALFWMDYKKAHVKGPPIGDKAKELHPYLSWAEASFHGWLPPTKCSNDKCPLTLEARASQGDHDGMALIPQDYVKRRICAPHAWHSSEMFLYLLDESRTT
jgi:hypothetical protein